MRTSYGIRYFDLFKDLGFECDDGSSPVEELIRRLQIKFLYLRLNWCLRKFSS